MRVPRARRGERTDGFTLVETIVTIGLIAVVAAFVIPTVVQRAGSIDSLKPPVAATTAQTIR
jgi:prepilin-type N-terminal cleavage/methylation domain-containing protein